MKMPKFAWFAIPAILLGAALTWPQAAFSQGVPNEKKRVTTPKPKYKAGEVLVRFRPGTPGQAKAAAHAAVSAQVVREYHIVPGLQLVRLPKGMNVGKAVARYEKDPNVLHAHPNYLKQAADVPSDPRFAEQWGLDNTGQSGGTPDADIDAPEAWTLETGSSDVVVAVVDSGVDYNHPDLFANMWRNPNDCNANGVDDDGNGYVDDCYGINPVYQSSDPMDDNGHGTHVAGIIGATGDNGVGVAGVNWHVSIMACKFLDAEGHSYGYGADSDEIHCFQYIADMKTRGVNIVAVNASFGGLLFDPDELAAIKVLEEKGILLIAAAGNDGFDSDELPSYPANYNLPNIISVAATDRADALASFSQFGRYTVDLGAPGVDILSTMLVNNTLSDYCSPSDLYCFLPGTSMAAPFVTGVAALLKAYNPTLDWKAIKNLILAGGDDNTALTGKTITGKRLNANGALTCSNSTVFSRLEPTEEVITAAVGESVDIGVLNINCAQPNGEVQVTVNPGGGAITLHDDGTGNDQEAGDGIYSGQFSPGAPDSYTLVFPGNDDVMVNSLRSYRYATVPSEYREFTGNNLNLGDDDSKCLDLSSEGFPIYFGDSSFSELCVGSNGVLSFTGPYTFPYPLMFPMSFATTFVAPFWDDLVPSPDTDHNVFWGVLGTSPNREMVIEWRDLADNWCSSAGTVKFQVVLFEDSSKILFNYADVSFGETCGADKGGFASVGIQVSPHTGTQYSYYEPSLSDSMSILWTTGTLAMSPSSLDFGGVIVGTTSDPKTVTVTNESGSAISISDVSTTGDFARVNNCPGSLNPDASCTIDVTFTPTTAEALTGKLTIKSDASGSPHSIDLIGNGVPPPTVELTPASLDFGQQVVGSPYDPKPVTLKNTGGTTLEIQEISIPPGVFEQSNDCDNSLEPDRSCTINVTFTPTDAGSKTEDLTVKSNAESSPDVIALTGEGTEPVVDLSPSSLDFGEQRVGLESSPKRVTLTNNGSATLNITRIATQAPFTQTNTCGSSVAGGSSCTIDVTFKPTTAGQAAGELTIDDDAPDKQQKVIMKGTGVEPLVWLSVTSMDFGKQEKGTTSSPKPVSLKNTGSATLEIQEISIPPGAFEQSNDCGNSLEPDKSCTINVTFKPTSADTHTDQLTVKSSAGSSPDLVRLTGEGVAPIVALSPSSLDFGDQKVGVESSPKRVTLTNSGSGTLSIAGIGTQGPFAQTNTCGSSVDEGASCTIDVTFKPTAAGTVAGELTITDNAPDSPQKVTLAGKGTSGAVSMSATSLDFGNQLKGTMSSAQSVTVKNIGDATFTVTDMKMSGDGSHFQMSDHCKNQSLDPQGTCKIDVQFKPGATGSMSANLTITTDTPNSTHTVALTGRGTDFVLGMASDSSNSASINPGQTAQFSLALQPDGFSGPVSLTCSHNAMNATCAVSPTSLALDGSTAVQVNASLSTTAGSSAPPPAETTPPSGNVPLPAPWAVGILALATLVAVLLTTRKRRQFAFAVLLTAFLVSAACGGGGGATPTPPPTVPGTEPGTYTLKVTATHNAGSEVVTRTVDLTVTVTK